MAGNFSEGGKKDNIFLECKNVKNTMDLDAICLRVIKFA